MDVERGNIAILFQKISYMAISGQASNRELVSATTHTYKNIDRKLYIRCAKKIFPNMTENERLNSYYLACGQMKDVQGKNMGVFQMLINMAQKLLVLDGDEVKCKFDHLLRWREISFPLGQDIFTCAFLADYDLKRGSETKCFTWLPIIRSDNSRLHNILEKGIAENHFHLAGSTKIFELSWLSLMNRIDNRIHDFKKINCSLQECCVDPLYDTGKMEPLYTRCQRAALYRVYLFSVMKKDYFLEEKLGRLLEKMKKGTRPEELVTDIQDGIILAKNIYGAWLEENILDYALEKGMINENKDVCRLLAGERRFLYGGFKHAISDLFTERQKNLFYAYLIIRTDFRGELIQVNQQVGFANFSNYQGRKEYFIEGKKPYEDELVRLALNESLRKKNMLFLEARICPKENSSKLFRTLKHFERIVNTDDKGGAYSKLNYVLHFPKIDGQPFVPGLPRNDNVRKLSTYGARSIVALLEKRMELNEHIKGIDACSSELACRPEVFGQVFRYLSDTIIVCYETRKDVYSISHKTRNLQTTYHAGEDFFDIVDGLRAIDETLLFCGLKRGSRLGHGLALGISPEEYYKFKCYNLVLPKQVMLDDIAWMLCRADEFGCMVESSLKTRLEENYYSLYEEVYGENMGDGYFPSIYDYYQSWKLRGDKPELYRLGMEGFRKKLESTELERFDRYQFNDKISNELRKNAKCRDLYFAYHFNRKVREKGSEITEFKTGQSYGGLVRQIQDHMIRKLGCEGIGIETNPSSNYLIGTIKKYEEHPIIRFNGRKLKEVESNTSLSVSINTDDQGVFDTLLENEYALMALALKKAKDKDSNPVYDLEDIYEWVDYVRRMGIEQVFV